MTLSSLSQTKVADPDLFLDWTVSLLNSGTAISNSSISVYASMWGKYYKYTQDIDIPASAPSLPQLSAFISQLADGIQLRYVQLLYRIFQTQVTLQNIPTNPITPLQSQFKFKSRKRKLPVALSKSVQAALISKLPLSSKTKDIRDVAIVSLILGSGLRVAELCSLTVLDVHLDEPFHIFVSDSLNGDRLAPIAPVALNPLKAWVSFRKSQTNFPSEYLFQGRNGEKLAAATIYRRVSKYLTALDFPLRHSGPMVLRHTFATKQVAEGRPLVVLQQWLGHHQAKSTAVYKNLVVNPNGWTAA